MESDPQIPSDLGAAKECNSDLPISGGGSPTVRDLMRTRPKTLPGDANVGDLRRLFTNPRVLDVVLVDGRAFVGVVDRRDVDDRPDDASARLLAHSTGVTIEPDASQDQAMARLDADGTRRLVVLGPDGETLEGLLCLNATRTGFCR